MRSSLVVLLAVASSCFALDQQRDPLARALHARKAARAVEQADNTKIPSTTSATTSSVAASPSTASGAKSTSTSTADAQGVASAVNQIFVTLQNTVAPLLSAIQSVINADPTADAKTLQANQTYIDSIKGMAAAFQTASDSTKKLLASSKRQAVSSGNTRRAQQTIFTPILTAFAGIANQAEQVCSTGPLGDVIFTDLFNACNPVISDLFGTLNDLVGDLVKTLSDLLGGGLSGVVGGIVPDTGLLGL